MKNTFLCIVFLLTISCTSSTQKQNPSEKTATPEVAVPQKEKKITIAKTVYVTPDGDKYHTADCRYAENALSVKLFRAKRDGKKACELCNPLSDKNQTQCTGLTQEGKQCSRMTANTSGKCFQHDKPSAP